MNIITLLDKIFQMHSTPVILLRQQIALNDFHSTLWYVNRLLLLLSLLLLLILSLLLLLLLLSILLTHLGPMFPFYTL